MDSGESSEKDIDPQTAGELKRYIDDRVEAVRTAQEQAWLESLQAAGFNRGTVENSVAKLREHTTMGRRAALGALASGVAIGFFGGSAMGAPGDDGDTVWGADTNRDDYYADEIDANLLESDQFTLNGSLIAQSIAASGSVTLSSGTATVDTGITAAGATFTPFVGVDDPNADVDIAARLFWDDSAGTYKVDFVEATTSVGNPTVNYKIMRVD